MEKFVWEIKIVNLTLIISKIRVANNAKEKKHK